MVRKFIKKVKRDGIIDEFRDRTHYRKPSMVKRIKNAARQRLIDKVNKRREELFTPTNKKRSGSNTGRRR
jgi:ribosomal protein S21